MDTNEMLQLDQPERPITFRDRGQIITYFLRRLKEDDWMSYFGGLVIESERTKGGAIERADIRTAGERMVLDTVLRVEGYALADGRPITVLPDWKTLLPYRHTVTVARLLLDVEVSRADRPFVIDPEIEEVYLEAVWGFTPDAEGKSTGRPDKFTDLCHRFTRPTPEQKRKYNRSMSESRIVGGSRTARTIYGGRHKMLIALYDELIQSVDGYRIGSERLEGQVAIVREMDACHKITAVQELFATTDVEDAEQVA